MRGWPLVGREAELDTIARLVRRRSGGGSLLVVGEPGVGKSRLLDEVVRLAEAAGTATIRLHAVPDSHLAPGALVAPLEGRADPRALIVVDDAHHVDPASAAALAHAVHHDGVAVAASLRRGERAPRALWSLWKDEAATRIDLGPLPDDAMGALVDHALDGDVDGVTRHRLVSTSGGNPLYLRELVHGCIDSGALVDQDGLWRLDRPLEASDRLVEIVALRLAGLDAGALALLQLVVFGDPLPLDWLTEEDERAVARLDEHESVVAVELGGRLVVRPAHPVYAEAVRARTSRLQARSVVRALLARAEPHLPVPVPAHDRRRIALWRLDAGLEADPAELLAAAVDARSAGHLLESRRLAEAAHDASPSPAAARMLGQVLETLGAYEESIAILSAARPETERDRALVGMAHAEVLFRGVRRTGEAQRLAASLEDALADGAWRDEVRAQRAKFAAYSGDARVALELAEPLLERDDARLLCLTAGPLSFGLAGTGRFVDAARVARDAMATRPTVADGDQMPFVSTYAVPLVVSLVEGGSIDEATSSMERAYEQALAEGNPEAPVWMAASLATAYVAAGRVVSAQRMAREAAAAFGLVRHPGAAWQRCTGAVAAALSGDAVGARDWLPDQLDVTLGEAWMTSMLVRAQAWIAAAEGRTERARDLLIAAADASVRAPAVALALRHDVVRLGGAEQVVDELVAAAASMQGPLAETRAAHAVAAVSGDGAALLDVATSFVAIGSHLLAAEAAGAAAQAFVGSQQARKAAAAQRLATEHASRCEGARSPAMWGHVEAGRLTRREQEIARLAADGLAAKAIAEELHISPRTAETHLQNAYNKLGVTSREELATALGHLDA
ncbi:MAG: AAA family ATPase [Acidimicrobiia bacterium]|nr:AAA family ATPase [Acidimicrobiia bacterium]